MTFSIHKDFVLEVCRADCSHSLLFLRLGSKVFKHTFNYLSVQLFVEGKYRTELKPTLDFMPQSYSAIALQLKTPLAYHLPGNDD